MKTKKIITLLILTISITTIFAQFKGTNSIDYNPRDLLLGNSDGDYSFFNMNNISLDHSFSMSFVSDSENSGMQNEYVAGLNFRFSKPLFMRVELGASYIPYSTYSSMEENQAPEVYVKSASLHYKISKNSYISVGYRNVNNFNNYFNDRSSLDWYDRDFIEKGNSHQVNIGFE